MPKQYKIDAVAEFKEKLAGSEIAIATQYVGINVEKVTELRKQLRESGIDFKVYKNTLARIALSEMGLESAADCMTGPTAWAFAKDPVVPAKLLKQLGREMPFVVMSGGVLNGKAVTGEQLSALADLPSREQLLAMLVGTIAAPMRNMLGVLNAVPRNLVNVLDQVRKQKEEGGQAA